MNLVETLLSHGFEILQSEENYLLATYNNMELTVKHQQWEIFDLEDNYSFKSGHSHESLISFITTFFR